MSYYHYTKGCHLPSIVKVGVIRTSTVLLEKNEKPAVWLSKSPIWDSACNIGKVVNHENLVPGQMYSFDEVESITVSDEYMKKEIGMCRILISETFPVISWAKFKHVSGISEYMYNLIDKHSRSIGSPVDKWICSFNPIPEKYWEGIEMYVDDQWIKWDIVTPIEKFVSICLNCNGKPDEEEPEVTYDERTYKEADFICRYKQDLIEFWESIKGKRGYIEVYVKPDYTPYDWGFEFKEKRIKKSSFRKIGESVTHNYALVQFLWEATFTQYKVAIPYEKISKGWDKSISN